MKELKELQNEFIQFINHGTSGKVEPEEEDEDDIKYIRPDELQIINKFLDRFIFVSQTSSVVQLDLKLALKAVPTSINQTNFYRIDMINLNEVQKSLIAFQNDDQDELFNYYDNRSKTRLRKINKKTYDTLN